MHAITDLGWPVTLIDVTLGVLARTGSPTPIYISGYDRGYEPIPFPGLYDPLTAGEVSPLLSAFEAAKAEAMPGGMVDAFPLAVRTTGSWTCGWRNWRGVRRHGGPRGAAARAGPDCPGPCSTPRSARWTSRCWPGPPS